MPNTRVGRRGTPNQVEIEGTEKSASCDDFGIDIPLDNVTIDEAARNGNNLRNAATERATNIVMLDREVRVAGLVTDPANYHADHVESLSGDDLFNDPASDPISIIEDMLDTCWARPNQVTFGLAAWRALRKHPKVVKAVHGNSSDQGRASRDAIAELLEVQRILVGESRINIKRPGENPVMNRVWDNVVAGHVSISKAIAAHFDTVMTLKVTAGMADGVQDQAETAIRDIFKAWGVLLGAQIAPSALVEAVRRISGVVGVTGPAFDFTDLPATSFARIGALTINIQEVDNV